MSRTLTIIFFIIISVMFTISCEEKEEPPCACGIENPQDNLEWLHDKLQSNIHDLSGIITEVYSIMYQDQEYIGIYISGNISHKYSYYYDCNGIEICMFNGYDGELTCDEGFTEAINDKELIYKREND